MPRKDPHKFRKLTFLILTQILLTIYCSHYLLPLKAIQHHKTWCLLPAPTQVDTLIFTQFPSLHPIKPRLSCPCFSSIQSFWIKCSPHPTLTEIRSGFQCSFTTKSTIKSALNCSQTRELLSLSGPSSPLLSQQASHSTHHI